MTAPRPMRKTREDWLDAAIGLLKAEGIEAVQITALSRALGITRGSFYWHFEDRADLLAAVLDTWRARNTGVMLDALAGARGLDDGLLALFAVWVDHTRFDPALDQAVRDWARRAPDVAASLRAEDDARIAAIAAFLDRHGFDRPEAFIRARVIYLTQVSYHALGITESVPERLSYLDPYFRCFIGRPPDAEAARAYFAGYLATLGRDAP
ncbi:TetR/AcrR family transcriptional regulator [Roseovarius sp. SCSIO 43702]|uniref:TetR/AcrR family transcriptional regulator n=1 Tax=Roseovarius sp. SCSIO 43702 TaxID=2823043 RepID=UPI001C730CAA|nr:TetR/AcrR family transcriptional regulator [Roseovarius sp. SCSIO 43702]QYX56653.1 TetR/AcrR family transcriptional regulator [Roseovarius sp. SCSIO 43702]